MNNLHNDSQENDLRNDHFIKRFTLILFLVFLTSLISANYLLGLVPGLTNSLFGEEPTAFWYLSRGSGIIAYVLLWLSMMLGTGITNKIGSLFPGLPATIDLHKFTSLLGLAFGFFHGFILLGDSFIGFTITQIFLPFSVTYLPFAVGLGQTALYLWLILDVSFYIRKKIGVKVWRAIHFASFGTFLSVLVHAILTGSDSSTPLMMYTYLITGSLLVFMVIYRILTSLMHSKELRTRTKQANPSFPAK